MTNEVSITVRVNDDTGAGREQIVAEAKATGAEAGAALSEGMHGAIGGGGIQEQVSQLLKEGRDAEAQALMNEAPSVVSGDAGDVLAQQIQAGGEKAVAAARSSANDMSSVFSEIYQRGSNASFQLANAMTAAWAGIEAETKGLTAAEKATFAEFNQVLGAAGKDAAVAFATGQIEAAQAIAQAASAATQAQAAISTLGDAAATSGGQMTFLSDAARVAYEEQQRLTQAEREGVTQFALFGEHDAPGMFTRVAEAALPAAAEVEAVGAAAEAAAGQLGLFTEAEIKWAESTNMAQRPQVVPDVAGWREGIQVDAPFAYSSAQAEADAAKIKAALESEAQGADKAKGSFGGLMNAMYGLMAITYLPQIISPVASGLSGLAGVGDHTTINLNSLATGMLNLGAAGQSLSSDATQTLAAMAKFSDWKPFGALGGSTFGGVAQGAVPQALKDVDTALAQLYQTNPVVAAAQFDQLSSAMEKQGVSAARVAQIFPTYTAAVANGREALLAQKTALELLVPSSQQWTDAVDAQSLSLESNAKNARIAADAQEQYLSQTVPGTQAYTDAVDVQRVALEASARQQQIATDAQLSYIQQVVPGTAAFSQALQTQQEALLASGYQAGVTAVAMLGLGDDQFNLNNQLLGSVDLYTRSTTQANAYNTVLTALDGTTQTLLGSEASFTIALAGVATAAQQNGLSLDVNNINGAKNIQTFTQLAQAADKAAGAVYQNEVNNQGSVKAYQDANTKLEQQKQDFIDNADKAGFNKDEVQKLADALFKLPPDVQIPVNVDTTQAYDQVGTLMRYIDTQTGVIQMTENVSTGIYTTGRGGKQFYASGGISGAASGGARGNLVEVGEQGRELVRLPVGASVVPNANVNAMDAMGAYGPGASGPIRIEFAGDFFELIRQHVRVRGGNGPNSVQIAFGQTN